MSRDICIYQDFLSDAHRDKIQQTAQAAGFTAHFFTGDQFEKASACLQHCEVLYAQSPQLLRTAPATLKWFCCSSAGVDPYCKNDGIFANPDCLLPSSAGAYGATISEHLIMTLLMLMRRMPAYLQGGTRHEWTAPMEMRSIQGSPITCLGTGDICTTFARKAKLLGAGTCNAQMISDIARALTDCDAVVIDPSVYDRVLPISRVDEVLLEAHVLVMALPGTQETAGVLSRERIALLPQDALVLNVGRGTAVDQEALMDALNRERIAGAALDVMVPEPLPQDHPLWQARNLVLTPHISGNMSLGYTRDRAVEIFCKNLTRYAAGEPLHHLVDRSRGY